MKSQPVLIRVLHLSEYILFSTYCASLKLINPTALFAKQFKTAMKKYLLFLLITIIIQACQDENPTTPDNSFTLTALEASCTEVWLQIKIQNIELPVTAVIYEQDSIVEQINNLGAADTVICIDSLLPSQAYKFKYVLSSKGKTFNSNIIAITTMDTTSHNFTWQVWTFGGEVGSCVFYDVGIFNEKIYATGRVLLRDSSSEIIWYNLIEWNGDGWELKSIKYGSNLYIDQLKKIEILNSNNIYFASGSIFHWNGESNASLEYSRLNISPDTYLLNVWSDNSSIYALGDPGIILKKESNSWKRIESGTQLALIDMCSLAGQKYIAGTSDIWGQGIILKEVDGQWETFMESKVVPANQVFHPYLYGVFSSMWADENTIYIAGNLFYRYKYGKWEYVRSLPHNMVGGDPGSAYRGYINKITGSKSNDMWIVGERNTLKHFNGISWDQIGYPYNPQSNIIWCSIAQALNTVAVVGKSGTSAVIMMIKR